MNHIGIMEGRLVPPEKDRFQAFPRERWAEEFDLAAQVPLSYIEWIFDLYGADVNPIATRDGLDQLRAHIHSSGVAVRSLCADYFMDRPFLRCSAQERSAREGELRNLMANCQALGIRRIVLPFVDQSRIDTPEECAVVVDVLHRALEPARATGLELHLETSLGPAEFADLLARIPDPLLLANYDSGNSSSLGYAPAEELAAYGHRVGSVHIKDRVLGGGTVPLGTGSADFPSLFDGLRKISYAGDFTLQVARGAAGDEVNWARQNIAFVRRYWP